jgi:CarD family transcriptional regulator
MSNNAETAAFKKKGLQVVHPAHGVGIVKGWGTQEAAGQKLETLYVLFERDKLKMNIPVAKAPRQLRQLEDADSMAMIIKVLKGTKKNQGGMWTKREKLFADKLNSGNLQEVVEAVRDLHYDNRDQIPYSLLQLLEQGVWKIATEMAAATKRSEEDVLVELGEGSGMDLLSYYTTSAPFIPPQRTKTPRTPTQKTKESVVTEENLKQTEELDNRESVTFKGNGAELVVHLKSGVVELNNVSFRLKQRLENLLLTLARTSGVVSNAELQRTINVSSNNALKVYISELRKELGDAGSLIVTCRGVGYQLRSNQA